MNNTTRLTLIIGFACILKVAQTQEPNEIPGKKKYTWEKGKECLGGLGYEYFCVRPSKADVCIKGSYIPCGVPSGFNH